MWHNVVSIRSSDERSSFIIITELVAPDNVLPVQLPMCRDHFIKGCPIKKDRWISHIEIWLPRSHPCTLASLQRTERPFTPPNVPSRTYFSIRNTKLYMIPLHQSFPNHLSLIVTMFNTNCDELAFIFQIVTSLRISVHFTKFYPRIPLACPLQWYFVFVCESYLRDIAQNGIVNMTFGCLKKNDNNSLQNT